MNLHTPTIPLVYNGPGVEIHGLSLRFQRDDSETRCRYMTFEKD